MLPRQHRKDRVIDAKKEEQSRVRNNCHGLLILSVVRDQIDNIDWLATSIPFRKLRRVRQEEEQQPEHQTWSLCVS